MTLFEDLKWRGLIKDTAGEDLEDKINQGGLTFYIGADPSADSLHIGQLPTFLVIERLRRGGHKPIILVGGATGRVGDPRGTKEREKSDIKVVENNFEKIKIQMKKLFGEDTLVVNNYDWFQNYNFIDFLRDIGKYVNVSYMINKDLVKRQMESGISYAEFSYMLIQGYDFKYIHDHYGATLQSVYAFSCPLTLDSTGKKIGKSEGNALWLDKEKTSSYELYQYLINFEDIMMDNYLKVYTFLSKQEIEKILDEHNKQPEKRIAQKTLAKEVITFLHGEKEYEQAVKISEALFSGNMKSFTSSDIEMAFKGIPPMMIEEELNLVDLLVTSNICTSKREAREFITNGSIYINGEREVDLEFQVTRSVSIEQKYVIIRKGKKKYYIIEFI